MPDPKSGAVTSFATRGGQARVLLVTASNGDQQGRSELNSYSLIGLPIEITIVPSARR